MPASSSSAEAWDSSDKLAAVIQAAGLNGADLVAYCRERGLYPQQLARWRQAWLQLTVVIENRLQKGRALV